MSKQQHVRTIGQAVSELTREFPDLTVSAMRFLEREGLLSPTRKPGGHRLYGEHDLNRVRRIKQWQAQRLSLGEIRERLALSDAFKGLPAADRLEKMLLELDIAAASELISHLYDAGMPLLELCDEVLTPALARMADDQGEHLIPVDVQMEFDEWLSWFLGKVASPPPAASGTPVVLAACPLWERHDLALRMLSALLMERGAEVHFLGSQLELDFLKNAIDRIRPDVVLGSLSTSVDPGMLAAWVDGLSGHLGSDQRLIVGGSEAAVLADTSGVVSHGEGSHAEAMRLVLSGN